MGSAGNINALLGLAHILQVDRAERGTPLVRDSDLEVGLDSCLRSERLGTTLVSGPRSTANRGKELTWRLVGVLKRINVIILSSTATQ